MESSSSPRQEGAGLGTSSGQDRREPPATLPIVERLEDEPRSLRSRVALGLHPVKARLGYWFRRVKRFLAPWLRPARTSMEDWFWRQFRSAALLYRPGWVDRRLFRHALRDKDFLLGYAVRALQAGDLRNGLNLLVNLSRIRPDVLQANAANLERWCEGSQDAELVVRMLGMLLGRNQVDEKAERQLREAMTSSDEHLAFAAKCLVIDTMLSQGRGEEAFDEFKTSWPLRCLDPYLALLVSQETCEPTPSRTFRACCPYAGPNAYCSARAPIDFVRIWNDDSLAFARMDVHRPSRVDTGCRSCFLQGVYGKEHLIGFPSTQLAHPSPLQTENLAKTREHFLRGDVRVGSYPVVLSLSMGMACNLRCVMCSAKWSKYTDKYDLLPEHVAAVLPLLPYAGFLTFTGGEPLLYPATQRLMEHIAAHPEINDHLAVAFTTNGTLLEKSLPWLEGIKNLEIRVSLDALGSAYQHIRGTSWERVERNVLAFHARCGAADRNWKIVSSNILMKSSLVCLRELVAWHCRHRIASTYLRVFLDVDPLARQEDLIAYPELLREIPDWREILHRSIAMLRETGDVMAAENLEHFREELLASLAARGMHEAV